MPQFNNWLEISCAAATLVRFSEFTSKVSFNGTPEEFLQSLIKSCDSDMIYHHYTAEDFLYLMKTMFIDVLESNVNGIERKWWSFQGSPCPDDELKFEHTYQNIMEHYEDIEAMGELICQHYRNKISQW